LGPNIARFNSDSVNSPFQSTKECIRTSLGLQVYTKYFLQIFCGCVVQLNCSRFCKDLKFQEHGRLLHKVKNILTLGICIIKQFFPVEDHILLPTHQAHEVTTIHAPAYYSYNM